MLMLQVTQFASIVILASQDQWDNYLLTDHIEEFSSQTVIRHINLLGYMTR